MLFNSPVYIFLFLPIVVLIYFLLNKRNYRETSKLWLVIASLYFYAYWNYTYLFLIVGSMVLNYLIGNKIHQIKANNTARKRAKPILILGIVFNLSLLAYYKYSDFFIQNFNFVFDTNQPLLNLILPLAISFFTFQQVAYLVDCYKEESFEYNFLNYCLFVTFFPQLIAGPIVHHKEMMPQFAHKANGLFNAANFSKGLLIFSAGLFKKVVIADTFAIWANQGFNATESLSLFEAWGASLSYTFQLYYDFSGYSDMALGVALMLNIKLPLNFNSPYKSWNIQEFWRRWHMTLSRWLRDYLYIPLGGNRKGKVRTYLNLMITFVLGGLWHGAGWNFIIWGGLHGAALSIHRFWQSTGIKINKFFAVVLTFFFVNFAWVFFRAETTDKAIDILRGMFGFNGVEVSKPVDNFVQYFFNTKLPWDIVNSNHLLGSVFTFQCIVVFGLIAFLARNTVERFEEKTIYSVRDVTTVIFALMATVLLGIASTSSEFLYFNF